MTGFADPVVRVEALSTAGQTVALMKSLGMEAGCTVRGCRSGASGTGDVTNFASADGIRVVPTRAFRNAFPVMQHCLLSTGKTSGTAGATTLTGLVTSNAGPLPVVEAIPAGVLTAAIS